MFGIADLRNSGPKSYFSYVRYVRSAILKLVCVDIRSERDLRKYSSRSV